MQPDSPKPLALRLPVLDYKAGHTKELPRVMSHKDGSHSKGMAGKKHVVPTDWLGVRAHCLKRCANIGRTLCSMPVKIFNSGHQASQELQSRNCPISVWTARSAVLQLKPCDCGQPAIEDILFDLLRDCGIGSPGKAGECVGIE